jgi:hypothetical protein
LTAISKLLIQPGSIPAQQVGYLPRDVMEAFLAKPYIQAQRGTPQPKILQVDHRFTLTDGSQQAGFGPMLKQPLAGGCGVEWRLEKVEGFLSRQGFRRPSRRLF